MSNGILFLEQDFTINQLKWERHYIRLMNRAQARATTKIIANEILGYVEGHHIIPKSMGGSNRLENIAYLTAKEHYIAHLLLTKLFEKSSGMLFAIIGFNTKFGERDGISKSAMYAKIKNRLWEIQKTENLSNSPRIQKMSAKKKGRNKHNHPGVANHADKMKGRNKDNDVGMLAMSNTLRGRNKDTHDYLMQMSNKLKGRTKETDIGLAQMSQKLKGRTKETHDGLAIMSEKLYKIKNPHREDFYNRWVNGEEINLLYEEIIQIPPYENLSLDYIKKLFKRIKKANKKQLNTDK